MEVRRKHLPGVAFERLMIQGRAHSPSLVCFATYAIRDRVRGEVHIVDEDHLRIVIRFEEE